MHNYVLHLAGIVEQIGTDIYIQFYMEALFGGMG